MTSSAIGSAIAARAAARFCQFPSGSFQGERDWQKPSVNRPEAGVFPDPSSRSGLKVRDGPRSGISSAR